MELSIHAKPRTVFGKQNKKLRQAGMLPAVLYGRGQKPLNLEVLAKEFEKVYAKTGESALVNLVIADGEERKVLIHDVARHFMSAEPIHVDFYEVDLTRKIHAKIPLHFVGTAAAVKELGGVLVKNLNEVEVEALPADLPPFLEASIEGLKEFDNLVRVSDLPGRQEIKILTHPEEVIVSVQAPRTEAELAELEKPTAAEVEKAAIEAVAKEEEVKKEGEEEGEKKEAEEEKKPEKKEETKTKEKEK